VRKIERIDRTSFRKADRKDRREDRDSIKKDETEPSTDALSCRHRHVDK
jgi:hypothetical protein